MAPVYPQKARSHRSDSGPDSIDQTTQAFTPRPWRRSRSLCLLRRRIEVRSGGSTPRSPRRRFGFARTYPAPSRFLPSSRGRRRSIPCAQVYGRRAGDPQPRFRLSIHLLEVHRQPDPALRSDLGPPIFSTPRAASTCCRQTTELSRVSDVSDCVGRRSILKRIPKNSPNPTVAGGVKSFGRVYEGFQEDRSCDWVPRP